MNMRIASLLLTVASSISCVTAWTATRPTTTHGQSCFRHHQHHYRSVAPAFFTTATTTTSTTALNMAIDYNNPVVAEEFNKVQPLSYDEVAEELMSSGIRAPPTMNDMELKLMLVEMRLRLAGKLEGDKPKERPATFSSVFEEMMWTKPAFEEFYNSLEDDHNSKNVVAEYLNNPDVAKARYATSYAQLIMDCEAALNAPPPVNSPVIKFAGFPSNMGEAGLKMTLEAVGPIVDLQCIEDDTFPVLRGQVTYEDIESAKRAVEQYNGMDMGMGTALEVVGA